MQPVTLHHHLEACGIDNPDASLWKLWFTKDESRSIKRCYILQILILLFIIMPIISFFLSLAVNNVFILLKCSINFKAWASGLVFGLASAIAFGMGLALVFGTLSGTVFALSFGIVFSVALSGIFCLTFGIPIPEISDVYSNRITGEPMGAIIAVSVIASVIVIVALVGSAIAFCLAFCVALAAALGGNKSAAFCLAVNAIFGMGIILIFDVAFGVVYGVVSIIMVIRFPLYLLEVLVQIFLYMKQKALNISTLDSVPVLYHELSYLPHPFLGSHILLNAETDPALVKRVLEACKIAPGQRRTGQFALAHLQARELKKQLQQQQFGEILELKGQWLPGVEGAESSLLALREVARYLNSAEKSEILHQRLQHLTQAETSLNSVKNQLLSDKSYLSHALRGSLPTWEKVIADLR